MENDPKAHYLMVEVIYHGRSLEASEKTMIQAEVARLIDRILKGTASNCFEQIVSIWLVLPDQTHQTPSEK